MPRPQLIEDTRMQDFIMNWVVHTARHMVVYPSRKCFGTETAMHEPLLIPDGLEGACRYLTDETENVRAAESSEADLFCGGSIWITGINRIVPAEQYQAGVEITFIKRVHMDPLAEIPHADHIARLPAKVGSS